MDINLNINPADTRTDTVVKGRRTMTRMVYWLTLGWMIAVVAMGLDVISVCVQAVVKIIQGEPLGKFFWVTPKVCPGLRKNKYISHSITRRI